MLTHNMSLEQSFDMTCKYCLSEKCFNEYSEGFQTHELKLFLNEDSQEETFRCVKCHLGKVSKKK